MWRCALIALAACNQIYGLDKTEGVETDNPDDLDGDGVQDVRDNCRGVANVDQNDEDQDGRGDLCDLCPLIVDAPDQDFDKDGMGDACDPHPDKPGDCVRLIETFRDPTKFDTGWMRNDTKSVIDKKPGSIRITPMPEVAIIPIGAPMELVDIQVLGTVVDNGSLVRGASNFASMPSSYRCDLDIEDQPGIMATVPGPAANTFRLLVPAKPITRTFTLRVLPSVGVTTFPVHLDCRAEFGVSIGLDATNGSTETVGPPAVIVANAAAEIDAVEISTFAPNTTCPNADYR
jgi:hypothetical protein